MSNLPKFIFGKIESKPVVVNPSCSEFEVNNWIISEFIIRKIVPIVGIRPYPLNEQVLMAAAVCRLKPTHIFEWGTGIGKSARIFFETVRYFSINCVIHSVDLPDTVDHVEHPREKRGKFIKKNKQVILHQGDGLKISLRVCKSIKCDFTPLFFLDGDHEYQSVKRELDGISRSVPQANILIHDTFYQSSKSGYNVGPYRAIQAFLKKHQRVYRTIATQTGLPGMTLIYR